MRPAHPLAPRPARARPPASRPADAQPSAPRPEALYRPSTGAPNPRRPAIRASLFLALGALALAPALAAGGCSEVIGLGPEPSASQIAMPGVCGLEAHPNPDCDACLDEKCCEASLGCYRADDDCVKESDCSLACAFDTACLGACNQRYGSKAYDPLETCLVLNCLDVCLPTGACTALVGCCQRIPKDNAAHSACVNGTNRNDSDGCQSLIDSRLLDPFCPGLAPAQ